MPILLQDARSPGTGATLVGRVLRAGWFWSPNRPLDNRAGARRSIERARDWNRRLVHRPRSTPARGPIQVGARAGEEIRDTSGTSRQSGHYRGRCNTWGLIWGIVGAPRPWAVVADLQCRGPVAV